MIYVNLTGIDNIGVAMMKGSRGPARGGYTNYELYYISQHPEIWSRVSFWRKDGAVYRLGESAKTLFSK